MTAAQLAQIYAQRAARRFSLHLKLHKWLLIAVSYATTCMLGVYVTVYQYTVLSIAQSFSVSAAVMGIMIGMQYLGMSVPPLFIGLFSGKYGKKKLLLVSYALIILGALLVGLTHSIVAFLASVFIIGAGFSVTEATTSAVLSDEFPEASRRHLNFSQVGFSIGALAGPLMAEALIGRGVYYMHLYLYCGALFLLLGLLFMFTKHHNDKGAAPVQSVNPLKLLGSRVFLFLALGICIYVGLETVIANYADSYYELVLSKPAFSALALSLFWGAMMPSRLIAGIIKTDIKKIIISLSVVLFVSVIAAMLVPDLTVKLVCFALAGFACGPLWPLMMDVAVQRSKGSSGLVLGVMMAFSGLGGALLPFATGAVVNVSDPSAAYYIGAAAVIAMLGMYFISLKAGSKEKQLKG